SYATIQDLEIETIEGIKKRRMLVGAPWKYRIYFATLPPKKITMPSVSEKGKNMPESPIRKLVPYAEKAYKANKTVYHLNIGQPDIKSPEVAMDAVANHHLEIRSEEHTSELQ